MKSKLIIHVMSFTQEPIISASGKFLGSRSLDSHSCPVTGANIFTLGIGLDYS